MDPLQNCAVCGNNPCTCPAPETPVEATPATEAPTAAPESTEAAA